MPPGDAAARARGRGRGLSGGTAPTGRCCSSGNTGPREPAAACAVSPASRAEPISTLVTGPRARMATAQRPGACVRHGSGEERAGGGRFKAGHLRPTTLMTPQLRRGWPGQRLWPDVIGGRPSTYDAALLRSANRRLTTGKPPSRKPLKAEATPPRWTVTHLRRRGAAPFPQARTSRALVTTQTGAAGCRRPAPVAKRVRASCRAPAPAAARGAAPSHPVATPKTSRS